MTQMKILIAGIGNIFSGDDAFGSMVARQMAGHALPFGVRVIDFGIRGLDLAYALLDEYDVAILVDAAPRGGEPGTLYVLECEPADCAESSLTAPPVIDAHSMDPVKVLCLARSLGKTPARVLVVGCEPAFLGSDDDPFMGLSEPVEAALGEAIRLIYSIVDRLQTGQFEADPTVVKIRK
jgi:hydrogenase maturation protease